MNYFICSKTEHTISYTCSLFERTKNINKMDCLIGDSLR